MHFRKGLFLFLLACSGCQQSALLVQQQLVTPAYLASTNVGSPDPRTPPKGEMILAEWWLPKKALAWDPMLRIEVLFRDFTKTCVDFPICSRAGYESYSVLNDQFKKTGGFLAYKVSVVTGDGQTCAEWKHQLWVKLISAEEMDETSAAVIEKSRQGSVIETPGCNSSN